MKEPTNEEIKSLSKREIDIINLLAQNQNSKQIAKKLLISHHTVNTHRKNILKKTKMNSTLELVLYFVKNNLL